MFQIVLKLLLSSSLKIDELVQAININSWLEYLINQNKLLFLDCAGWRMCIYTRIYVHCICRYLI